MLSDPLAVPLGAPPSTFSSTLVVDAVGLTGNDPRGPAIDVVFKTRWQPLLDPSVAPPKGPQSTLSSNSVVDAVGPAGSVP
jgi:hypothetical protein